MEIPQASLSSEPTVLALRAIKCPMRHGVAITIDLCSKCEHHGGIRMEKTGRFEWLPGETHNRPILGEAVECRFPKVIFVNHIVVRGE